jgi:mono/diheme cytochrome c family protein
MIKYEKLRSAAWGALVALPMLVSAQSATSQRVDFGQQEFQARCASCHGRDGKGNGPIADLLRKSPPDLTALSRANGGIFPMSRVYDSIVGDDVRAHGAYALASITRTPTTTPRRTCAFVSWRWSSTSTDCK